MREQDNGQKLSSLHRDIWTLILKSFRQGIDSWFDLRVQFVLWEILIAKTILNDLRFQKL